MTAIVSTVILYRVFALLSGKDYSNGLENLENSGNFILSNL